MRDCVDAEANTLRVIEENPAYRIIYLSLLDFCREERSYDEALSFCETIQTERCQIQSAAGILAVLVRCGAIAERLFVNGIPYEGSFSELQTDETVDEDSDITATLQTTIAGAGAADEWGRLLSLSDVEQMFPHRMMAFEAVLSLCAEPGGKSTRELQEELRRRAMLEVEEARGIETLHASYFTGKLESIGALEWNGKSWTTGKRGLAILGAGVQTKG